MLLLQVLRRAPDAALLLLLGHVAGVWQREAMLGTQPGQQLLLLLRADIPYNSGHVDLRAWLQLQRLFLLCLGGCNTLLLFGLCTRHRLLLLCAHIEHKLLLTLLLLLLRLLRLLLLLRWLVLLQLLLVLVFLQLLVLVSLLGAAATCDLHSTALDMQDRCMAAASTAGPVGVCTCSSTRWGSRAVPAAWALCQVTKRGLSLRPCAVRLLLLLLLLLVCLL
jgi:hypothetical protein